MFRSARNWTRDLFARLAPGTAIMLGIFSVTTFFFLVGEADDGVMMAWTIMFIYGLVLYNLSYSRLLPVSFTKKFRLLNFIGRAAVTTILSSVVLIISVFIVEQDADTVFNLSVLNFFIQMLITTPVSWFVFKRKRAGDEEIILLKKELGQSTASVDLLRSQINPHFLFNVLNTLYGTALQEKAERTSEGIQLLGNMMRFMLHENLQQRISLAREVEYLHDYITLQKLRLDTSSDIHLDVDIPSEVPQSSIAPMLLIPFVENAFKHGISFREPSYIRIVMTIKNNTLFFDVTNSTHAVRDNDLEKNSNGIGLANVRQRLGLTYPKKHELIIKESGKDFFIHLTIQLS